MLVRWGGPTRRGPRRLCVRGAASGAPTVRTARVLAQAARAIRMLGVVAIAHARLHAEVRVGARVTPHGSDDEPDHCEHRERHGDQRDWIKAALDGSLLLDRPGGIAGGASMLDTQRIQIQRVSDVKPLARDRPLASTAAPLAYPGAVAPARARHCRWSAGSVGGSRLERWQSLVDCSCLESSRPSRRPGGSNPSRSACLRVRRSLNRPEDPGPVSPSRRGRGPTPSPAGTPSGRSPRRGRLLRGGWARSAGPAWGLRDRCRLTSPRRLLGIGFGPPGTRTGMARTRPQRGAARRRAAR